VSEIPRHWRLKEQRYKLVGEVCPHCETKLFPPRDVCPECGQDCKKPYVFSGKGEVYSAVPIQDAPAGFKESAPYVIGLIRLEEGPLVTAQITDIDPRKEIPIGTPVEMVTRKLRNDGDERGMIIYGYKFRPVEKES